MRGLNPDQLRTFLEVVELGSFTAAAKRLNLSQPAVSLQIRELEARCGVQLLERLGKKPFPTVAGRQLLVHAQRILDESEHALASIKRLQDATGNQVRLGMTMTTLTYHANDVVRRLKREHKELDLSIILHQSSQLAETVRNNNLDLAIVSLPIDGDNFVCQPFMEDNVVGIVPEDRYATAPKTATPQLFAAEPFVMQGRNDVQMKLADQWFRAAGQAPRSFVEVDNLEACRAAVAAGLGVSILPGVMAQHALRGVTVLSLDPPIRRQLAIIEHKGRAPNKLVDLVRTELLACGLAAAAAIETPRAQQSKRVRA